VMITAETTEGPYQVAYQYITFSVTPSDIPSYGGQTKSLSFINGSWSMVTASSGEPEQVAEDTSSPSRQDIAMYALVGCAVVIIGAFIAIRVR